MGEGDVHLVNALANPLGLLLNPWGHKIRKRVGELFCGLIRCFWREIWATGRNSLLELQPHLKTDSYIFLKIYKS